MRVTPPTTLATTNAPDKITTPITKERGRIIDAQIETNINFTIIIIREIQQFPK